MSLAALLSGYNDLEHLHLSPDPAGVALRV
jgi:hypothetical protein